MLWRAPAYQYAGKRSRHLHLSSTNSGTLPYKVALADRTEFTKAVITSQQPIIEQRRAAYMEYRQTAREAKDLLEVYYYRAKAAPSQKERLDRLNALENKMGIGSGGAGSSWASNYDAISVVRKLILLRIKHQDTASASINSAVENYIDVITTDLSEGEKQSNQTPEYEAAAVQRVRKEFEKLNGAIDTALRLDVIPIK